MRSVFDLDVLTAFVVAVDLKSLSAAASMLGRSTSAVSAQIKRLDDTVGLPVFQKHGRGLELTETGLATLGYARRLLELNKEALKSIKATQPIGYCRVCVQQDFCEDILPDVLGVFSKTHPSVRIEVVVANNSELHDIYISQTADLILAWDTGCVGSSPYWSCNLPVHWIGPIDHRTLEEGDKAISLVTMREDCHFRSVATAALEDRGLAWHVALTSPSLSGVWAGVKARLGVTARTSVGMPEYLTIVSISDKRTQLPVLSDVKMSTFLPNGEGPTAVALANLFQQTIERRVT